MPDITIPLSSNIANNSAGAIGTPTQQTLINMHAIPNDDGMEKGFTLRQRYGLDELADTTEDIYGMGVSSGNIIYIVTENYIKRYSLAGSFISQVSLSSSPSAGERFDVIEDINGEMYFLSNLGTYYKLDTTLTSPSFAGSFSPTNFTYLGLYYIFDNNTTNQFFWSDLNDGSSFSALSFATAEQDVDDVGRVYAANNALWILGTDSVEVWQKDDTNPDSPFVPILGSADTTVGCLADFSVAQAGNSIIFLGSDRVIYRTNGYELLPLSNEAINERIARMANYTDARGYTFFEYGYWFYVITFPSETLSFCCNLTTGQWHRRTSTNDSYWYFDHIRTFNGTTFGVVGQKLYRLTRNALDDEDYEIFRTFTTNVMHQGEKEIMVHALRLHITTGTVLGADPQSPVIYMSYSNDGGFTYSAERQVSLGGTGAYGGKIEFRGLGTARRWNFKFRVVDTPEISVTGCSARIEVSGDR